MILIIKSEQSINLLNNEKFIVLNDICEIKHLQAEPYSILLLNVTIDDEGIIKEFNYYFEEIIISLDIVAIITTKPSKKLREICDFHHLSLLEVNEIEDYVQ